jgi:hypothetical protein
MRIPAVWRLDQKQHKKPLSELARKSESRISGNAVLGSTVEAAAVKRSTYQSLDSLKEGSWIAAMMAGGCLQ